MQTVSQCIMTLLNVNLHNVLQQLAAAASPSLGTLGNSRCCGGIIAAPTVANFDHNLFYALATLAKGLFVNNTNATYPMKALLLVTGLMPAFDNQVRNGLHLGGFSGTHKTQYLLPANGLRADGKKISRLPFLLGDCWNMFLRVLSPAIAASQFPQLLTHPGRVFDVLLFMQGNEREPLLIMFQKPPATWYEIL
jgi:hypothetical protein